SALSGGAPSADPNHESARAVERREPAPDEGHSALPDRALVPDAALRQFDGGVDAVARDSDDRRDAAASRSAARRDNANDEGGSRRVARNGGYQRLQAFTGRKGLDRPSLRAIVRHLHADGFGDKLPGPGLHDLVGDREAGLSDAHDAQPHDQPVAGERGTAIVDLDAREDHAVVAQPVWAERRAPPRQTRRLEVGEVDGVVDV